MQAGFFQWGIINQGMSGLISGGYRVKGLSVDDDFGDGGGTADNVDSGRGEGNGRTVGSPGGYKLAGDAEDFSYR